MKNLITFVSIMLIFFTSSCKKDTAGKIADRLYNISFNLSNFSVVDSAFLTDKKNALTNNTVPVSANIIEVLYCKVYDNNGKSVQEVHQSSADANFGKIGLKLPAGTYTVVFSGGHKGLKIMPILYYPTGVDFDDDVLTYKTPFDEGYWETSIKDTFLKRLTITIGEDINKDVVMERIVGKIVYTIKDRLPANVAKVRFEGEYRNNVYPVKGGDSFGQDIFHNLVKLTVDVPPNKIGTKGFSGQILAYENSSALSMILTAYDNKDKIVAQKIIPQVRIQRNKTTYVTGELFGGNDTDTDGYQIVIDPEWVTDPDIIDY